MRREIPEPWASAMVNAGVTDPRNATRPSWSELGRRTGVHASTLIGMADGTRKTDQDTINKVAETLKVDKKTVAGWVNRSRTEETAYKPPAEADLLDRDERKAVDQLITLLARSKQKGGTDSGKSAKKRVTSIREWKEAGQNEGNELMTEAARKPDEEPRK